MLFYYFVLVVSLCSLLCFLPVTSLFLELVEVYKAEKLTGYLLILLTADEYRKFFYTNDAMFEHQIVPLFITAL